MLERIKLTESNVLLSNFEQILSSESYNKKYEKYKKKK